LDTRATLLAMLCADAVCGDETAARTARAVPAINSMCEFVIC
jgi:hypothetical protein